MKRLLIAAAIAASSIALSGCVTGFVRDLSPDAKKELALKFLERCGGTVNIGAGGATGQLGGGAHAEFQLTGVCPQPDAPRGAPGAGTFLDWQ